MNNERGGSRTNAMGPLSVIIGRKLPKNPTDKQRARAIEVEPGNGFEGGLILPVLGGNRIRIGPSKTKTTRCYAPKEWMRGLYEQERTKRDEILTKAGENPPKNEKGVVLKAMKADPTEIEVLKWFLGRIRAGEMSGVFVEQTGRANSGVSLSPAGEVADALPTPDFVTFLVRTDNVFGAEVGGEAWTQGEGEEDEFRALDDGGYEDYDFTE